MEDPIKRRTEIVAEIFRLGKQQKKAARGAISAGQRSLKWKIGYDERTRRIAGLVLELVGLTESRAPANR